MTNREAPRAFYGRTSDLDRLERHLAGVTDSGRGKLLAIRGRRQVGKSRLLTEFVRRSQLPQLFFTGSRQATKQQDIEAFIADALREASLPGVDLFAGAQASTWEATLRLVEAALRGSPAIIVLDEFPWLVERDPGLEGTIQKLWDTLLEAAPVLMILVGSDEAMMASLSEHGHPLFGRSTELVIRPLNPTDCLDMLGDLPPSDVLEAHLITGGYPRLLLEFQRAGTRQAFLEAQLNDEFSDLCSMAARVLESEFREQLQARVILSTIGFGERTFTKIAERSGVNHVALARALEVLRDTKHVVATDQPRCVPVADEPRHRVADTYLRFWFRFIESSLSDIARGRPELAITDVEQGWLSWCGRAIEPLIREALGRLAASDERLQGTAEFGGYWTRTNDVEVDLVGVDRYPRPRTVRSVGSIKWRAQAPFDQHDYGELVVHRTKVPGAGRAKLVAVSRAPVTASGLDATFGPDEIVRAWA